MMVNGLYDFDPAQFGMGPSAVIPHVGIGAGWARARVSNAGYFNGNTLSGEDDFIAFQGIAGFDYAISPAFKLTPRLPLSWHREWQFYVEPRLRCGQQGVDLPVASSGLAWDPLRSQSAGTGNSAACALPPPPPPPPPPAPIVRAPEAQRSFQVFFDFDKSDLTDAARQVIQQAATTIKSGAAVHIIVTGHTDTVGSAKYNQALSERRATSVKQELVANGVPDDQIATRGVGKTDLLVATGDGVREPQNRRATIDLQPPGNRQDLRPRLEPDVRLNWPDVIAL